MAKVGTSNQDRTISLKAAVRSCIKKNSLANKTIIRYQNILEGYLPPSLPPQVTPMGLASHGTVG